MGIHAHRSGKCSRHARMHTPDPKISARASQNSDKSTLAVRLRALGKGLKPPLTGPKHPPPSRPQDPNTRPQARTRSMLIGPNKAARKHANTCTDLQKELLVRSMRPQQSRLNTRKYMHRFTRALDASSPKQCS
eukprot:1158736-Pelagomonas_calceolata.AAC.2